MRRSPSKRRSLTKSTRKRAIIKDFMKGVCYTQEQLAARHGVTPPLVSQYIKEAMELRHKQDGKWMKNQFKLMEHRLMDLYAQTLNSYELSKQPHRETHVKYVKVRYPACQGTGWEDGDEDTEEWCDNCGGDGRIVEEQVTETIKGQAGDSSFLSTGLAIVKEWNKLHGNYPRKGKDHFHYHEGAQLDLSKVPNNVLLDALDMVDILRSNSEGKVLDVKKD